MINENCGSIATKHDINYKLLGVVIRREILIPMESSSKKNFVRIYIWLLLV